MEMDISGTDLKHDAVIAYWAARPSNVYTAETAYGHSKTAASCSASTRCDSHSTFRGATSEEKCSSVTYIWRNGKGANGISMQRRHIEGDIILIGILNFWPRKQSSRTTDPKFPIIFFFLKGADNL